MRCCDRAEVSFVQLPADRLLDPDGLHDHVDERRAELGRGSSSDRLHLGAAANARVNVAESIEVLTGFSLKTRS